MFKNQQEKKAEIQGPGMALKIQKGKSVGNGRLKVVKLPQAKEYKGK